MTVRTLEQIIKTLSLEQRRVVALGSEKSIALQLSRRVEHADAKPGTVLRKKRAEILRLLGKRR